jgi:hypothetical protein
MGEEIIRGAYDILHGPLCQASRTQDCQRWPLSIQKLVSKREHLILARPKGVYAHVRARRPTLSPWRL